MKDEYIKKLTVFKGKAGDMTRQTITAAWLKATRPVEPSESVDFSKN